MRIHGVYGEVDFGEDDDVVFEYHGHEISVSGVVEYDIEPAQHGGRTDPSWEAYAYPVDFKVTQLYLDGKWPVNQGDRFFDRIYALIKDEMEGYEFEKEMEAING